MTLKTYQAPTMAQALAEVKRDLGRDAVILHTRMFRRGGLLAFWRRQIWEVTASPNLNVPQRIGAGKSQAQPGGKYEAATDAPGDAPQHARAKAALAVPDETAQAAPPELDDLAQAAAAGPQTTDEPGQLAWQVHDIRQMVEQLLQRPGSPAPEAWPDVPMEVRHFQKHFVGQDIDPACAERLLKQLCMSLTGQQLSDRKMLCSELRKLLASRIRTDRAEPPRPRRAGRAQVISLIGPTGVGKTTTIAKLAANYKLREGKTVGLITIDTYRIAAVDQLRTYADIIEVPLRAVLTAGELHQAVESMGNLDVVLIDTAGRSQNNRLRLSQLKSFIAAAEPDEVHLVVSATANRACTAKVLERFMPLGANRIIVTKLDEAGSFGVFLSVSEAAGGPISYVTTGQDVPEDIARADADTLAECILSGRFGEAGHGG
jgi:flagellar biosynthesis protein FlhF